MTLLRFLGDWLYGLYISFFKSNEENEPGDDAT